ncbi:GerMN domain-containing protein [Alkaliphilus pronyensis]|uniref:GerMN domain-containing protein n=1 Tax=Alkaliphilus pronyensis TaxID=1482732 RepID=A0A6I0F5U5_9FIRM|nr:GerMN domain-containing protein [Alkaliphilus pronyensis]KAB3537255.1 GerMN domain-containing protein [Alkaliphilus pronyensis]
MKKNYLVIFILIVLLFFLLVRCANNHFIDNSVLDNELKIAPYPERIVELMTLYFADFNNQHLVKETRAVERMNESREEIIMRELMKGPVDGQLQPTVPTQVKLYSITTVEDTTYINFSKEFVSNFKGGESSEVTTIYSIVNSLTELQHVDKVKIQVEGEGLEIYQHHMSLKDAYNRNERIIEAPFPSPIEVIRLYFGNIINEQYRYAYDQIYRPLDINLDYSIFFHQMRELEVGVQDYVVNSYSIFKETGVTTIVMDYEKTLEDGTVNIYKDVMFRLRNDLGEWKIIYETIVEDQI